MNDFATAPGATDPLVTSAIVVWLIQKAKESNLSWLSHISQENPGLLRLLAALGATLTAAGLTWTWDASGTLTVNGLTASNLLSFMGLIVKQYIEQYLVYKVGFKPTEQK